MPIKKLIKRLVYGPFGTGLHFSQSGEDLNILAIAKSFIKINNGFYVDVGAFHPHIGSNKLPNVVANIRETILKYGGEVHFDTCVNDFTIKSNKLVEIHTNQNSFLSCFKTKAVSEL